LKDNTQHKRAAENTEATFGMNSSLIKSSFLVAFHILKIRKPFTIAEI
jgi:hypothetical protein